MTFKHRHERHRMSRTYTSDILNGFTATDDRINYTHVESFGLDMDDMLSNAYVGREDWHGNELKPLHVSELPDRLYGLVERDITQYLSEESV